MNTNYTDEQLQAAIDAAFPAGKRAEGFNLDTYPRRTPYWAEEAPNRLAIARAFLAALPAQPGHCVEADQKAQPWTLPAPPPGRRWHREDWTADMLPDGYRPLLEGEAWLRGDEIRRTRSTRWDVAGQIGFDVIGEPATKKTSHCRTRRPLPAEASAEPEQAEEKPCGLNSALLDWPSADEPAPAKSGHGWPYDDLLKSMEPKKAQEEKPWMSEARQIAAQCWCDPETSGTPMDVRLAEAVAKRIQAWMETSAQNQRNADYYRSLVVRCGEAIGEQAYIAGDGGKHEDVLCAKVPELVKEMRKERDLLEAVVTKCSAQPTQSQQAWTPKPGDVVRLKSGGPKMAVDTVAEPDEHREGQLVYGCFWIAEDGRPQAFKLPAVLLQPAD